MAKKQSKAQQVLNLAREMGVLHARDARKHGIHYEHLRRLCEKGLLTRVGRGLYVLPDAEVTGHHGLALAAKAVPKGVICLLSALQFHEVGTQSPFEVWVAIDRRAARPRVSYPSIRFVRFSGKALTEGIEEHTVEGVPVQVYCVAKSVVDCFRYRNKVGLDVALEALREAWRSRKCTSDELWNYAKVCRVAQVVRPYLEATL